MDAFSRLQMEEDTGKQFNNITDIPTPSLTKGARRTWLGIARDTPTISPAWLHCGEHTSFMEAHTIGVNEFQTLLPVHLHKTGRHIYSPANGTIITRVIHTPVLLNHSMKYMLSLVESTLLGSAAGTTNTGRALVMYQMQLPTIKSKIIPLSDTLEIKYEGMYDLPTPEGTMPVDITITMTWVYNAAKSRVLQRYQDHPYLRITIVYDIKAQTMTGLVQAPEYMIWHNANRKLLQFQLMGPVRQAYGMDRNPVPYLSSFLQRAEANLGDGPNGTEEEEISRRIHSFVLETLLGRRGTTINHWIGIPIAWLQDAVHRQTLQATARAVLPAAAHPPLGRTYQRTGQSRTLQDTSQFEALDEAEKDLNNIEQQRSEYQRLHEDANKKPAAKKSKSTPTHAASPAVVTNHDKTKPAQEDRKSLAVTHRKPGPKPTKNRPARISPTGVVDMTQGIIRNTNTGPPHADHPIFSPQENVIMRREGMCIFGKQVYAPEGINKYLKRFWDKRLADGKLYKTPSPPSTSMEDSDSTPPKRNQKKTTKRASKLTVNNSESQPKQIISLKNRPELVAAVVFTGPPPNATEAEVRQWVLLWFQHHAHKITPEGIAQCLNPHQTTPQWIQTWVNNAHAHFAQSLATNAP